MIDDGGQDICKSMDAFSKPQRKDKISVTRHKAFEPKSARSLTGDYGEAVPGSTVADESSASSEPNKAELWLI